MIRWSASRPLYSALLSAFWEELTMTNQEFTKSIFCFNEDISFTISTLSMCSKNSADLTGHLQTHKLRKRSSHCDIVIIMMFYKSNSNQFHCGILGIVVHEWCMVWYHHILNIYLTIMYIVQGAKMCLTFPERCRGPGWPGRDGQRLPWNAWEVREINRWNVSQYW